MSIIGTTYLISLYEMRAPFINFKVIFVVICFTYGVFTPWCFHPLVLSCLKLKKNFTQSLVFCFFVDCGKTLIFLSAIRILQYAKAERKSPFFEDFEICLPATHNANCVCCNFFYFPFLPFCNSQCRLRMLKKNLQ